MGPKSSLAIGGAHDKAASRQPRKRAAASTASTTRVISVKVSAGTNTGTLENNEGWEAANPCAKS
jgi:hypothetical protein